MTADELIAKCRELAVGPVDHAEREAVTAAVTLELAHEEVARMAADKILERLREGQ